MKIMVSACLLGDNVKYDGGNNYQKELAEFLKDYEVVKVCPEVFGGLPVPRDPSEIKNGKVVTINGKDVTREFTFGAYKTLDILDREGIHVAILKKNSPSCGFGTIYDGTFSHIKTEGNGITSQLLKEKNIIILNEDNYKDYFK